MTDSVKSAAMHIQNALAILRTQFDGMSADGATPLTIYRAEQIRATRDQLASALHLLDASTTLHPYSIAAFLDDLAEQRTC